MSAAENPIVNELAQKAHQLARELGDTIEWLQPYGVKVSAEVELNSGESLTLHDLNGEIELRVYEVVEIPEESGEEGR